MLNSFYVKFQIFTSSRKSNCFTKKELCFRIYLKILRQFKGLVFQNYSWWLPLKILPQIKAHSKLTTKNCCSYCYSGAFISSFKQIFGVQTNFWSLWEILLFLKPQPFPINNTSSRSAQVYYRTQKTPFLTRTQFKNR